MKSTEKVEERSRELPIDNVIKVIREGVDVEEMCHFNVFLEATDGSLEMGRLGFEKVQKALEILEPLGFRILETILWIPEFEERNRIFKKV